jgi:ABC-type transporter Mla subunit MlaD
MTRERVNDSDGVTIDGTVNQKIDRLVQRQEAMIGAIHGLTDVMEQTRDLVTELMAWLQEPPSSELPDLLKALTKAVSDQGEKITAMHGLLVKLPAQVARTLAAGEVA